MAVEMRSKYGDLKVGEAEYLKRIDGLIVGENPRQGIVMRGKFYHPDMGLQFDVPPGWRAKNEASSVTLVDPRGRGILVFSIGKGNTPEEAARSFVASSKTQPLRMGASMIGGKNGYVVESSIATSNGAMRVRNEFLSHGDRVVSFLSYSSVAEMDVYGPSFASIVNSFGPIRDASIRDIAPARLKVITTKRSGRFSSFIGKDFSYGLDAADFAIMNQVELSEMIEPGRKLKTLAN